LELNACSEIRHYEPPTNFHAVRPP
jgi:hypothetical protein